MTALQSMAATYAVVQLCRVAMIVFAGTLSVGTLWEIIEFALDRTGLFAARHGLIDTMIDPLADALGALLALSIFAVLGYTQTSTAL